MTLIEIAKNLETDKERHGYLTIYEKYFREIKNEYLNILEIGIWTGESLKLWSKYFLNANIIGIDSSPTSINEAIDKIKNGDISNRVNVFLCDQSDKNQLNVLVKNRRFDLIMDDGSHYPPHQIIAFRSLFEILNPGGLYIIEDLHASYQESFAPHQIQSLLYIFQLVHALNFRGKVKFAAEYQKEINKLEGYDGKFEFIHFYPHVCIIKKR